MHDHDSRRLDKDQVIAIGSRVLVELLSLTAATKTGRSGRVDQCCCASLAHSCISDWLYNASISLPVLKDLRAVFLVKDILISALIVASTFSQATLN